MKHSIRQRVINQYGLPVTKIEQVTGELGSGVFDKNGKEIFEGDLVRKDGDDTPAAVTWEGCELCWKWTTLSDFDEGELEVVGHVDD